MVVERKSNLCQMSLAKVINFVCRSLYALCIIIGFGSEFHYSCNKRQGFSFNSFKEKFLDIKGAFIKINSVCFPFVDKIYSRPQKILKMNRINFQFQIFRFFLKNIIISYVSTTL